MELYCRCKDGRSELWKWRVNNTLSIVDACNDFCRSDCDRFFLLCRYCELYTGPKKTNSNEEGEDDDTITEVMHYSVDRWDVAIWPKQGRNIAFVNNCHTSSGSHVTYILNQIVPKIVDFISQKYPEVKDDITPNLVRSNLTLFLNCLIENPSFDSQVSKRFPYVSECGYDSGKVS